MYISNRPIIVCGVQRSGTSLVAGILFKMGVFMGKWFLKRNTFCPLGFFEDMEFAKNDKFRYLKKGLDKITKKDWEERVRSLIKDRTENQIPGFYRWGWKSPSTALFIKDYIRIVNPQIIWCQREKEANMESLGRMFGDLKDVSTEDLYTERMNKMEEIKDKCHIIKLENLKENSEYEIGRLAGHLNLNVSVTQYKKALNQVLKPLKEYKEESYRNYL